MVYLNVSWNKINRLSECTLNTTGYTEYNCPDLKAITPFGDLLALVTLDFSHNEIRRLTPYDFFLMRSLTYLDLTFNKLQEIERNVFTQNGALLNLQLANNEITHVEKLPIIRLKR
jgi:Leucine-rich repeat (LRR) protein